MTELRKLIEAVESVGWDGSWNGLLNAGIKDCPTFSRANHGSLDASKAMHDSLLPGWIFDVTNGSAFVCPDTADGWGGQFTGESDVDARAWLIAILKAYEAQQ